MKIQDELIEAAAKLNGNAYKLWVLIYICKLTPVEITNNELMASTTLANNIGKAMFGEI